MVGTVVFLLVGVVLCVAGGVLLYFRRRMLGKAELMRRTRTSGAAGVSALSPGTLVEVKGTLRCERPLQSEMAKERCAYYSSKVAREYLERDRGDGAPGSGRRSEVLARSERFAPFVVEDDTGGVPVSAEGAEVDAKKVVDCFERGAGAAGLSVTIGGATIDLGGGERTLGYRHTEEILPVDAPVYVLGAVRRDGGIGPPEEGAGRFVVSWRSEEALGESLGRGARLLGLIALGLFLAGAAFLAVGAAAALGYLQFR